MNYFFSSLPSTILACFKGRKIIWHILAIFLTCILVFSGVDWHYFLNVRSPHLNAIFLPAIILGALFPIVIPLSLIISGHILKKASIRSIGWLTGQAALIGSIISSVYKAFTGRIQPNLADLTHNISTNFNFGFLKHGIFWGWPSSHTTIAFAMAFLLIGLFPKNVLVRCVALIYAFYIGIGVSFSIHWFSDFVAGAIIGTVIGVTVARRAQASARSGVNDRAVS